MNTRRASNGFTLIELLLVVALIALVAGLVSFALPNPSETRLEREAERLALFLESARAQSRGTGIAVRWIPRAARPGEEGFQFVGLAPDEKLPTSWLYPGVSAEILGVPAVTLGPEPLIGSQRIVLRLNDQRVVLSTNGLGPFEVADSDAQVKR